MRVRLTLVRVLPVPTSSHLYKGRHRAFETLHIGGLSGQIAVKRKAGLIAGGLSGGSRVSAVLDLYFPS